MSDTKNFLNSLAALRDSTKYVLDFLNNQDFTYANIDNENSSDKNEDLSCSQAFDVLKTLKRDVRTFTNTNFITTDSSDSSTEEFKECETADLDNLHSQLSMIVDNFSSDIDVLNSTENSASSSKQPKLDIVLSHQETLKSIDKPIVNQIEINLPEKEKNNETKNDCDNSSDNETSGASSNNKNKINSPKQAVKENELISVDDKDKSIVAKSFLFTNTMPQTPEIEKIKNYVTDVDLNKLNNIEIIKLILDSLVQNCNELLQLKSDTLSDVLGVYPKSPLSEAVLINNYSTPLNNNNPDSNTPLESKESEENSDNEKSKENEENSDSDEKLKEDENKKLNEEISSSFEAKAKNDDKNNKTNPKISVNTNIETLNPIIKTDDIESLGNPNKQRNPRELIKELECLIILIHSLYENKPKGDINEESTNNTPNNKPNIGTERRSDSMLSILTSNTELNSVINAIDSLLKSSPRFNNQCVQINAENKKKFQLMGVLSVVDRMTRTRLNDQRASPNQLDRVNRLIDLLNKSLVRQYVEQRFTISPDKEKKMEFGRISYLVEKSKNSRLSNQDWCSQKLIREKEIEDIFDQTTYKSLENQRFIMRPAKERDMYLNTLLKRVDKLDSYRLSNQDAVIKKTKPVNDSLYSINGNESDAEISPTKRKEGPIKRLRRFSKSIMS